MMRKSATLVSGSILFALVLASSGCTSARQAERAEPPSEISVRFPAAESPDVSLRAEEQKKTPDEVPPINDEIHRPWLKAIEVTVTPGGEPASPNAPPEPPK